jgi:ATP-dependent helicase HepA
MTHKKPIFSRLEMVHVKGGSKKMGYIWKDPIPSDNGWQYEVMFSANEKIIFSEEDLVKVINNIKFGDATDLLRALLLVKLKNPLSDHLYGAHSSRTEFHVYQFKPALKFLNNPDQRLLIADEVGLGKTIEAGIIYLELQARLDLARILVVCPPALTYKWQDEMRSRFDEKFTIMDRQHLENFFQEYDQYGDSTRLRGIVTLHLIRRAEIAEQLAERKINFDFVIFDEAHHLRNPSTLSNAVANVISENADAMVFLTATPLHLGNQDLFHLLQILAPAEFDNLDAFSDRILPNKLINHVSQIIKNGEIKSAHERIKVLEIMKYDDKNFPNNPYYKETKNLLENGQLSTEDYVKVQRNLLELNSLSHIFTRTRKREVMIDAPIRDAHTLRIKFTPEEEEFYRSVIKFVKGDYRDRLGNWVAGWATVMRERQAASCISAIRKKFSEELKNQHHVTREDLLEVADLSDDDNIDLDTYEEAMKEIELPLFKKQTRKQRLESLVNIGNQIKDIDTKFDVFHQALLGVLKEDPSSKILVFAFFRGTLDYLHDKLQGLGFGVRIIHGDIKLDQRKSNVQQFKENQGINILLSSEVGSEGLDFQFCNTIFNYDLPWNPMKVEQRIGRLDRFGQKHKKIKIFNLIIENSIEERIFLRLYERIGIFKAAVGDLEAILGEEIRRISKEIFSSDLTPEQETNLAEQAARNLVRQQQELEEFEKERQSFMGQDRIFGDEIEEAILEGRYISGTEVEALVKSFANSAFSKKCLKSDPEDPTCFLSLTDEIKGYMRKFLLKTKFNDQSSQSFLQRINHSHGLPVTFSSEVAYERKLVEFINFRHPLTRAALKFWDKKSEDNMVFKFSIQREKPPFGVYYFFIFRFHFQGLNQKILLEPVVIDSSSFEVQEEISQQLLSLIQSLDPKITAKHLEYKENEFDTAKKAAIFFMANQRDQKQTELEKINNSLIDARISALDHTFNVKSSRVKQYLESAKDPRIIRMRRAQLRNIESTYLNKYEEIDTARNCSVSYQLELPGMMMIFPN